jgi:hypothetical protein
MSDPALIGVLIAMAFAVQMLSDPRITRQFLRNTAIAAGVYLVHTAIGIGFLFLLISVGRGPHAVFGVIGAYVGWIGLGILGLIRFAPRLREPPRIMHVGIADVVCLAMIAAGVAATFGWI